jgi:hypothetical protein
LTTIQRVHRAGRYIRPLSFVDSKKTSMLGQCGQGLGSNSTIDTLWRCSERVSGALMEERIMVCPQPPSSSVLAYSTTGVLFEHDPLSASAMHVVHGMVSGRDQFGSSTSCTTTGELPHSSCCVPTLFLFCIPLVFYMFLMLPNQTLAPRLQLYSEFGRVEGMETRSGRFSKGSEAFDWLFLSLSFVGNGARDGGW